MTHLLGRYDAGALRELFAEADALAILTRKGFRDVEVRIESPAGQPHARIYGCKHGARHLLLDAILAEAVVPAAFFAARAAPALGPAHLLVIYWLREQDPTASFTPDRPPLPLQGHPGLGLLRQAFRVALRMARELGKDGVANVPKFFHDAVIFYRSRLFLFLDGGEQGRFEALMRDLAALPLGDASLALAGGAVTAAAGRVVGWTPRFQVLPLSPALTGYFNAPSYADAVGRAVEESRFAWDDAALARARAWRAGGTLVPPA